VRFFYRATFQVGMCLIRQDEMQVGPNQTDSYMNRNANTLLYAVSGLFLIGLVRASLFARLLL
jgi:hypothetical protein